MRNLNVDLEFTDVLVTENPDIKITQEKIDKAISALSRLRSTSQTFESNNCTGQPVNNKKLIELREAVNSAKVIGLGKFNFAKVRKYLDFRIKRALLFSDDIDDSSSLYFLLEICLPRNGINTDMILTDETFELILTRLPRIGKWIFDSYITIKIEDSPEAKIEFNKVTKYTENDEFTFDLTLDGIQQDSTNHWIYKLIKDESDLINHPLVAVLHEFKSKNGGILWYWIGSTYFAFYHFILTYVIYKHPAPVMYDCDFNESTSKYICRDDCPNFTIPIKPGSSPFWTVDDDNCYNKWHQSSLMGFDVDKLLFVISIFNQIGLVSFSIFACKANIISSKFEKCNQFLTNLFVICFCIDSETFIDINLSIYHNY